ncbi:MAG: hypothetical protein ABR600_05055 [Actinomycetota bacterium]
MGVTALTGPVSVCLDRPVLSLDRPFTYELASDLEAGVGSLVSVRFHGKLARGWVLGPTEDIPPRMLKVNKVVSPVPFFDEGLLELYRWMSERYIAPLATVIGRSSPPRVAGEEGAGTRQAPRTALPPAASTSLGTYRNGALIAESITTGKHAIYRLRHVPEHEHSVTVEAVDTCLRAGRRAIVIVPEADPVPATADALREAFGDRVCAFLGGDKRKRYRMWLDIQTGRYDVVVGTRPAVFAPITDLGLIWVSREGHALHREERSPYFHVRDVAAARAEIEGATLVMSALCHSAEAAVMEAVDVAPATRSWPPVEVVKPGPEGKAPRLVGALKSAKRAFVYEPLPGYGVARVCKACGEPAACAACGGLLRAEGGSVRCTVCEAEGRCANCGSSDLGIVRGGAERVEEWVGRLVHVPVRRRAELGDGITIGGAEAVKDVPAPSLDLVGILDADLAARRPGLSAMERSLAVWMDAAGWARPEGRVIVQSHRAGDPAIQALVRGNPAAFHRSEAERRSAAGFPVGHPVFRVVGTVELLKALEATDPAHLLETSLGDDRVCLVTVRPDRRAEFGRTVRTLAERGIVSRVEAEPHL